MKQKRIPSITAPARATTPLENLARRLNAWRASRTRGQRIPPELWNEAADLARVEGLNVTARALRLDYYDLQRRLGSTGRPGKTKAGAATFMELPAPDLAAGMEEHRTVEVFKPSGARLRIHLPHSRAQDWLALVRVFLRQRV